ncbi:MAG: hypothetical protein Q9174_001330 [Haloplaca sp. 1 TL-2023]
MASLPPTPETSSPSSAMLSPRIYRFKDRPIPTSIAKAISSFETMDLSAPASIANARAKEEEEPSPTVPFNTTAEDTRPQLPFYTTTTTTLHTTVPASVGQVLHLTIPAPDPEERLSYTDPPRPSLPGEKAYPYPLPVLVVTQLEAVVSDTAPGGKILSTITTVRAPPDATDTEAASQISGDAGNDWKDWTAAERVGVIAGAVVAAGIVVGLLLWCMLRRKVWEKRGQRERQIAKQRWAEGDQSRNHGKETGGEDGMEVGAELNRDVEERIKEKGGTRSLSAQQQGTAAGVESAESRMAPEMSVSGIPDRTPPTTRGTYLMSGALPSASSRAATQLQPNATLNLPESARHIPTPVTSETSGERVSPYRAWRAEERRAERARAYLRDPLTGEERAP